jgi:pimeloyl-ACP methyl ester carboxylesterase
MARFQLEVWKMVARAYGVDSTELAIELCTKAFSRGYLDGVGADALDAIREVTARNVTTEVFCAACDAMIEADVTGVLARISAPTLVLVGAEDILTPLDCGPDGAGVRAIARAIPDARLHVFEGCGHGNLIERADESASVILDFLRAS